VVYKIKNFSFFKTLTLFYFKKLIFVFFNFFIKKIFLNQIFRLEPLLDPLVINPNSSTVPTIDIIDNKSFAYEYESNPERYSIGGFNWNLIHKWIPISQREKARMKHPTDPIRTPTMIGAFFVIMKENFLRLGMFDEGYEIWGAENLELSFKVWCCGGEMLQVPCSHAGHLFRKDHPYSVRKESF
jgi:polypeptide N-acetylgalactosaminyltransferase